MKTVLITGATGFLGSYLVRQLQYHYKIIILKRSFSNTWRIDETKDKIKYYNIDNKKKIEQVFDENHIDIIIHTATCYGHGKENMSEMIDANIAFPLRLLELSVSRKVSLFVNTDTSVPKNINNYALSKKQFLEWLNKYSDKLSIINMIIEHMYGPADNEKNFITWLIRKMLNNESIALTAGEQKRDFIFIQDVVNAYIKVINDLTLYEKPSFLEFEIGCGRAISIKNVVQIVYRLTQSKSELKFGSIPYRKNELMKSDTNLFEITNLGWFPSVSIEEGLEKTVKYEKGIQ